MSETIPVLQEHQAAGKDRADPLNFEPTPDERKLIVRVNKLFERYRNDRNNHDTTWMDDYKFFRGRQWSEIRPSYRHSEVINLVFQTIQSQVPILTDARPKFEYVPSEPEDREFAEFMNEVTISDWQSGNWLYKLTEVLYDGHIYGTGLSKLDWDPDANQGRGAIDYRSDEIFYIYPDPDSENVNERSGGFIRAEPMSLGDIKLKWPEKGKFVRTDVNDLLSPTKSDLSPLRFRNPTGEKSVIESSSMRSPIDEEKALVITIYYDDKEIEEVEVKESGEDGDETLFEQRKKFPQGRRAVIAGNVVLEDGPNPYDDGEWPWQRWVNYMLPREFWGESEVAQIRGPQKIFNKVYSFVLDVLTLTGNPVWVIDSNSGVDPDMVTNAPGMIIEKHPEGDVRREPGTQLQLYVLQLLGKVKEYVDQIAGAQDITRGIPSGGVTAASAIADLQNAAQTRQRQKSRNIDAYLQDLGTQYASRVMQFYTAPRTFNYTGSDGVRKYFRAHIEEGPDGEKVAKVQKFDENGVPSPVINEYQLRGALDVRVTTGTALASSKARLKKEQLELFDRGIIDRQEFFKSTDYPNWEVVEERLAQQEAQAAEAEAQVAAPA
jgi:hypothetical protein